MNSLRIWLLLISLFPIFILFGTDLGVSSEISSMVIALVLIFPLLKYVIIEKYFLNIKKNIFVIVITLILAMFNILLSIDPLSSLFYWIIYLGFIYGIGSWLKKIKKQNKLSEFLVILKNQLGYYLFLNSFVIYVGLFFLEFGNGKTLNTFGIITGSAVVYFWFLKFKNLKIKMFIILILIYFLLISLSRSSLLITAFAIFVTELILYKKNVKRKFFSILFGISIFVFFTDKLINWFSEKQTRPGSGLNSLSDLLILNKDRANLINHFIHIYSNNFFTGYGLDTQYQQLGEWDVVDNIGIHNGLLEMILMIGIPLSVVFFCYFFVAFKRTIKLAIIDVKYASILGFVLYCFFRSYGESYFLLNIGNIMSILFIIILVVVYNSKEYK